MRNVCRKCLVNEHLGEWIEVTWNFHKFSFVVALVMVLVWIILSIYFTWLGLFFLSTSLASWRVNHLLSLMDSSHCSSGSRLSTYITNTWVLWPFSVFSNSPKYLPSLPEKYKHRKTIFEVLVSKKMLKEVCCWLVTFCASTYLLSPKANLQNQNSCSIIKLCWQTYNLPTTPPSSLASLIADTEGLLTSIGSTLPPGMIQPCPPVTNSTCGQI